jgi:hypothetical protein
VGLGQLLLLLPAAERPQGKGIRSHPIAQIGGISKILAPVEPHGARQLYFDYITHMPSKITHKRSDFKLSAHTHESK